MKRLLAAVALAVGLAGTAPAQLPAYVGVRNYSPDGLSAVGHDFSTGGEVAIDVTAGTYAPLAAVALGSAYQIADGGGYAGGMGFTGSAFAPVRWDAAAGTVEFLPVPPGTVFGSVSYVAADGSGYGRVVGFFGVRAVSWPAPQ